mgnify:FL=1
MAEKLTEVVSEVYTTCGQCKTERYKLFCKNRSGYYELRWSVCENHIGTLIVKDRHPWFWGQTVEPNKLTLMNAKIEAEM